MLPYHSTHRDMSSLGITIGVTSKKVDKELSDIMNILAVVLKYSLAKQNNC